MRVGFASASLLKRKSSPIASLLVETIAPIVSERHPHAKKLAKVAKILDRKRCKAGEKSIDCCCVCSGCEEVVNVHVNDDDIVAISLPVEAHVAFARLKTGPDNTRVQQLTPQPASLLEFV